MLLGVSLEGTCIRIKVQLGVGTHIHRTLQERLQILDVHAELILVRPPRRLIHVLMELPDVILVRRKKLVFIPLPLMHWKFTPRPFRR